MPLPKELEKKIVIIHHANDGSKHDDNKFLKVSDVLKYLENADKK